MLHEQIKELKQTFLGSEVKYKEVILENKDLNHSLNVTKENQNILANELVEFKLRYQEVLSLLNETQEQLKLAKKNIQINNRPLQTTLIGSLQTELMEASMISENSVDSGIAMDKIGCDGNLPYKKVFDTVKYVSRMNPISDDNNMLFLGTMAMSSSSQPRMTSTLHPYNEINALSYLYPKPSISQRSDESFRSSEMSLFSSDNSNITNLEVKFI